MGDLGASMVREDDSPSKCSGARRRRIEMRRLSAAVSDRTAQRGEKRLSVGETSGAGESGEKRSRVAGDDEENLRPSTSQSSSESSSSSTTGGAPEDPVSAPEAVPGSVASVAEPIVAFGLVSLAGRSREMEDAVCVRPSFFQPESGSPLHFFAVFDGHGGSHVSALCKDKMHTILAEELAVSGGASTSLVEKPLRSTLSRSFARMDDLALSSCVCGRVGYPLCRCDRSGIESGIVGSTAVVAIVDATRVVVANCGDSRAVLSRGGRAVALSDDHKPDRVDEFTRIHSSGGRVIFLNGARVNGILAMSRALGDKYLKPVVISEPEIKIVERSEEDECLIVASDGLWDVLSNDVACDIARRCLQEADPSRETDDLGSSSIVDNAAIDPGLDEEQASDPRCSLAAALLARLALGRKSSDNISVIVIDLRRVQ